MDSVILKGHCKNGCTPNPQKQSPQTKAYNLTHSIRHGTCPTHGGNAPLATVVCSWPPLAFNSADKYSSVDSSAAPKGDAGPIFACPTSARVEEHKSRVHVDAVRAVRRRKPFLDAVLRHLRSPAFEGVPRVP